MRRTMALAAVLVALASGQHWEFEQVDSAGWGANVEMRWHPDGRLFLCYSDTSGITRLASKDSVWSYEDLPQWRPVIPGTQAFDIDRRGNIGVSYIDTDYRQWYALKTDTGWADIQTPFYPEPYPLSLTTFDTAGDPAITFQLGGAFVLARMADTSWACETVCTGYSGFTNDFYCCALGSKADGAVWGVFDYSFSYPGRDVYGDDLYSFEARDSGVDVHLIIDATGGAVSAASGCVDRHGSVHSCYAYWHYIVEGTYLDQTQIDTAMDGGNAVKFDSLDRPQIAYVSPDGDLKFRYLSTGIWRVLDLQVRGLTALDLTLDQGMQPLIAYTTSAGVFLARGIDIVGQAEEPQAMPKLAPRPLATVWRRVPAGVEVFDAMGRRVARPRAGVYFIENAHQGCATKFLLVRD